MSYELIKYIKYDYFRYKKIYNVKNLMREFIKNRAFRYSVFMRIIQYHNKNGNKVRKNIWKIVAKISLREKTIEIPFEVEVGKGLYMGHFTGITINPNVILGNNINIHKGITIGQENRGKRKGTPKIGNKVWVGINSTIVGNITIGDNVLIAPNSFINFDVPSNSIVVGNKIKKCINATEGYINNIVE